MTILSVANQAEAVALVKTENKIIQMISDGDESGDLYFVCEQRFSHQHFVSLITDTATLSNEEFESRMYNATRQFSVFVFTEGRDKRYELQEVSVFSEIAKALAFAYNLSIHTYANDLTAREYEIARGVAAKLIESNK